MFGDDLIREIEKMGQIPKSKLITREEVKILEEEFSRQDSKIPLASGLIEHIEDLELVKFDEVTENTPLDASVEIQRFGFSRVPVSLSLAKVNTVEEDAPVQLLWLLKIDDLLKEAIQNVYYSPFRPAPILENFRMEFNILQINSF